MFNMETGPEALSEYERILGLNEDVLRFLNIRIDEVPEGPSIMMQAKTERPQRGGRDDHDDGWRRPERENIETDADNTTDEKSEG